MYLTWVAKQIQLKIPIKLSDMKKLIFFSAIILAVTVATIVACNKNVEGRTDEAPALAPANIDLNAGIWKPVLEKSLGFLSASCF